MVTQWQVVGCVERISESFLIPLLEGLFQQFPFAIRGFHSDNGSEFVNHRTAELLENTSGIHQIARTPLERQRLG